MASKAFDVIVLGATGFTGRQAVLALTHRGATQPLRWAVAGRNLAKLRGIKLNPKRQRYQTRRPR